MSTFPFHKQLDSSDCGPTCLRMIAKSYGKDYSLSFLREKSYIGKEGVSIKSISEAAEAIGFRTLAVKLPLHKNGSQNASDLTQAPLPCVVHWNQNHFVVVHKITKSKVHIADPAVGKLKLTHKDFEESYHSDGNKGMAILMEPTSIFWDIEPTRAKKGIGFLFKYLKPHRQLLIQLFIGLLLGTFIQLLFPFLTQSLVDIGIDTRNLNFIYLVLAGQLMLFFSQTVVRFIQSWILLHVSTRVNVNLIAEFLLKLMNLPLGFFDSKNTGDLLQRIDDHKRIEYFLTQSSLAVVLSVMNIVVFGIVLLVYSLPIFLIFLIFSILYLVWIFVFLKKRREVDYMAFSHLSDDKASLIEMIQGMSEIKLQGSQLKRRWKWANIQSKLFAVQMKSLSIVQYQEAGALSINRLKDILITFIAAKAVLDGQITLGMMLAIQYIIGQLNGPLAQLVGFVRSAQDAHISMERLSEVHNTDSEETLEETKLRDIPSGDIEIEGLSFQYSPISELVLDDISLVIPHAKTTAVVGNSGSGKTTLIKLLLGFYPPSAGLIKIGNTGLAQTDMNAWRSKCGAVMQEGFIFSDTIANNIAESDDKVDHRKIRNALDIANLNQFIQTLPLGIQTMVGAQGNGLSQGQKQRLLIARAAYKNPDFIFFDEATNSLDANNEKEIMQKLNGFLKGKTVVIVAHRLSTVKHADNIVVLDKGKIVERGNHEELIKRKGFYFTLVQNQLELGD